MSPSGPAQICTRLPDDAAHIAADASPTRKKPRRRLRAAPHPYAFTYTVADTEAMCGFGRTKIYELVRAGKLRLMKVGARSLINGDDLRALLGVQA
jgi:excisionase family DNA binding protein